MAITRGLTNEIQEIMDRLPEDLQNPLQILVNIIDGELRGLPKGEVSDNLTLWPAVDIDGFFDLVKDAVDDYQERKDISSQNKVIFSEEEPRYHSDKQDVGVYTEYITFKLIERMPGKVQAGRMGLGRMSKDGRREWAPQPRYIKKNTNDFLQREIVMGQFFDNVVEFTCWAQTNKSANARALWFQDLMAIYRWFFKAEGVSEVLFNERLEDESLDGKVGANNLKCRKLRYYVKTDRTFTIREAILRELIVNITPSTSG